MKTLINILIFLITIKLSACSINRTDPNGIIDLLDKCIVHESDLNLMMECVKRKSLMAFDRLIDFDSIKLTDIVRLVKNNKTTKERLGRKMDIGGQETKIRSVSFQNEIFERVFKLFNTHMIQIKLNPNNLINEGRRRRHNSIMMFGLIAMGMILIPMGFKFVTILGAKALLLAKMALLLSSIQGLKRIATSGINYGLYQHPYYDSAPPYPSPVV